MEIPQDLWLAAAGVFSYKFLMPLEVVDEDNVKEAEERTKIQ